MKKKDLALIVSGATLGTIVLAKSVASRRSIERIPTGHHAIENDELARGYAKISAFPITRPLVQSLATRALRGVNGSGKFLDIGAGPGLLAIELAKGAPKTRVTGIDPSDAMINLAYENVWHAPGPIRERVQFQRGSAELLPFPDKSFDLVVSTLALHHVTDPIKMFNEVSRVLRPNGRFMLFDMRRDMGDLAWFTLWLARNLAPARVREANEPLASRDASYTPAEISNMAWQSDLPLWRVATGNFWLSLENMDTA